MKRSPKPPPWITTPRARIARNGFIEPALRQQVRDREGGCCALCREPLGGVWECHHRKLRSRGGLDSVCNLIALCASCHRRCHSHVAWAQEQGFIVSAYADPASTPLALGCERWVLLRPDGCYADSEAPAA